MTSLIKRSKPDESSNSNLPRKQNKLLAGLAACLALAGLALLAQGLWIPAKAQLAQILLEQAWSKSQQTGQPQKAWSWADTWPVAKISIPAINLSAIILREAGGEGLAFGPVLLNQSAPLGTTGTTIISAHRDTHFKGLNQLKQGDTFSLATIDGQILSYQITHTRIARWDRSGLDAQAMEPELVLVSCWPFDAITPTDQRFLLHARQITDPVQTTSAKIALSHKER